MCYKAGFSVIQVTSGLPLGFLYYEDGLILTGVYHHGNLRWDPTLLWSKFIFQIQNQNKINMH